MSQRTFYVRLHHRHISRGGGRWVPAVGVCDDQEGRPSPLSTDVALYAVECSTKSEACDIVTHWLAKGRPDIMRVSAVWEAANV